MYKCINCGKSPCELHHVVPLSLGGNDVDPNKVPLCSKCHTIVHGTNPIRRGTHWKELQKAGIEKARAEGKYKGKPKMQIDENAFRKECIKWRNGEQTAKRTMENLGLKPNTFYRRVKEYNV